MKQMIPENFDQSLYPERRAKSRMICDYRSVLQMHDLQGKKILDEGRAANLSASGVYLSCTRPVANNTQVLVKINLPTGSLKLGSSLLNTNGVVVRCEYISDKTIGIAVKFNDHDF